MNPPRTSAEILPLDCPGCGGYDLRDGEYVVSKHKPDCSYRNHSLTRLESRPR